MPPPPPKSTSAEARALQRARDLPNARTATDIDSLRRSFLDQLQFAQGKDEHTATRLDHFFSLAYSVRDRLMQRWIETQQTYYEPDAKRVYYLSPSSCSAGRSRTTCINLGVVRRREGRARRDRASTSRTCSEQEPDAGLGNGGLGRLAACFLDSMATLGCPATATASATSSASSTRSIRDGWQVERADEWLRFGNPWEIARPEYAVPVALRRPRRARPRRRRASYRVRWVDARSTSSACRTTRPIAGYGTTRSTRCASGRRAPASEFDLGGLQRRRLRARGRGQERSARSSRRSSTRTTSRARPARSCGSSSSTSSSPARIARHRAALPQDAPRTFDDFADKVAIQLNDTHPAIAVAELMRVLVDEQGWRGTRPGRSPPRRFGYTNHTLLPEALETLAGGAVRAAAAAAPARSSTRSTAASCAQVHERAARTTTRASRRMSIIEEGPRASRCAWRTSPSSGSHAVNGVAALHTRAPQDATCFRDFARALARAVQQQDERRHAAALAAAVQPAAGRR